MSEHRTILTFLDHICVKLGFCLPEPARTELASRDDYTPDEIARAVLKAEELDPDLERRHFRAIRNEFISFFDE